MIDSRYQDWDVEKFISDATTPDDAAARSWEYRRKLRQRLLDRNRVELEELDYLASLLAEEIVFERQWFPRESAGTDDLNLRPVGHRQVLNHLMQSLQMRKNLLVIEKCILERDSRLQWSTMPGDRGRSSTVEQGGKLVEKQEKRLPTGLYDHLLALNNTGEAGFSPMGWLYDSIMKDLVSQGFAIERTNGSYIITESGKDELKKFENDT